MLDQRRAGAITKIVSGGTSGRGPSVLCGDALWREAVRLIRASESVAVITGFFVPSAGAAETDGPAGSVVLARALLDCGLRTEIWTDFRCEPVVRACAEAMGHPAVRVRDVSGIVNEVHIPGLLIYVERLGRSASGAYYDMRGNDISAFTSPLDEFAIRGGSAVIGIGDGGNEVGMGNFADSLAEIMPDYAECLSTVGADVAIPADVSNWGAYGLVAALSAECLSTVGADVAIPADVSNWGAYGLVAALSLDAGVWLGHSEPGEINMAEALLKAGAVDGLRKTATASVDGFDLQKQLEILTALRGLMVSDGC